MNTCLYTVEEAGEIRGTGCDIIRCVKSVTTLTIKSMIAYITTCYQECIANGVYYNNFYVSLSLMSSMTNLIVEVGRMSFMHSILSVEYFLFHDAQVVNTLIER